MVMAKWDPKPILVEHLAEKPPETLYHYTTQGGLLEILKSRVLWTSSIRYLNDHREFTYGAGLLEDYIRAERGKATDDRLRHLDVMLTRLERYLRTPMSRSHVHEQLHLLMQHQFYVASWSTEEDDLAQWRAYSGSGTGYAIGMRGETIAQLAKIQRFSFARCVYKRAEHDEWIKEIVEQSLQEMLDDEKQGVKYDHAVPGDNLLYRLLRFAPLIKHPKFHGEGEWRLIMEPPGPEHHDEFAVRAGRSTLIPHFRFKLELLEGEIPAGETPVPIAFSKIMVGPCAEQALAVKAVQLALGTYAKGNDGGRTSVGWSDIPHRNWV